MLTELRIRNFKAWKDTGLARLAPLTVIFGANSAGKSSLGHLLLGLQQTTLLTDRRRAIHLGDRHSPIDLGTLSDCLYEHDLKEKLEFTLGWRLPQAVSLRDPLSPKNAYKGDHMRLESVIRADSKAQPQLEHFRYELREQKETTLKVEHGIGGDRGKSYLNVEPLNLVKKQGRGWPIEPPEKFYRFSDVTLARYQNADALSEFPLQLEHLLAGLTYLGPLREPPQRTYSWAGDTVPDVGARGELAIPALLAATQDGIRLNRGPRKKYEAFDAFVARWLRDLGVIDSFVVRPIAEGRKEYEVLVRTRRNSAEVKLTDVGFGVSQILPALVQAFYAQPDSMVWMEQPEIHLHPQVQAELAEALTQAADALAVAMGGYVEDCWPIPQSWVAGTGQDMVAQPVLTAAKLALYTAMRDQGVTNEALAERLGVSETVVRRLVHPDHHSKIERVEQALAALGKHLVVEAA